MKRILLTVAMSYALASAIAAEPQFMWGTSLYANGVQTSFDANTASTDGRFYAAGRFKSTNALYWQDTELKICDQTSAVDFNLFLPKIAPNGALEWVIYSTIGNIKANTLHLAATSDGGVVVTCRVRHNQAVYTDESLLQLVQGDGSIYDIAGSASDGRRSDYGLVMRISATGTVEWHQLIVQSADYGSTTGTITDGFTIDAVCVDAADNVFIGGRYLNALTLPGDVTLSEGVNAPASIGTTVSKGDGWIARLDATDGHTTATYAASDYNSAKYADSDEIKGIAWLDGTLYAIDLITPSEASTVRVFDTDITTSSTPTVACLAIAMPTDYTSTALPPATRSATITSDKGNTNGVTVQINGLNAGNSHLLLTGCLKGALVCGQSRIASGGTQLEGFFIDLDPSSCTVNASATAGNSISDFRAGIVNSLDHTYILFGYNLTKGMLMETFNTDGTIVATDYPVTNGTFGIPAATFDNVSKQLILTGQSNKTPKFAGSDREGTPGISTFTGFVASYRLADVDDSLSGIENVSTDAIENADAPIEYYNLQGIRVITATHGIYIRRQGSAVTKIRL